MIPKGSVLLKNDVKIIFHIDLNAFFCSCAIIKEPYLKDKVFAVGGSATSRRGVISTSSYSARKLGIKSAMSINDALHIYPKLILVPLDFSLYKKYSNHFFDFLKNYSDTILEGSIDEAYVDMTEKSKTMHPLEIAKGIQEGLLQRFQLPCSIGIGPTLFLAKMASDMQKPLGITVLRKKDIVSKLFLLPIKDMYGIGKKTYPKLEAIGIKKIGDFTKKENKEAILNIMSEQSYLSYLDHIMGRSSDIIDTKKYAIPKSISNETTLNYSMDESEAIFKIMTEILEHTHERLVDDELVTKTIGIRLKTDEFVSITRSQTLDEYTDDYETIYNVVESLFEKHYDRKPIRLVGVSLGSIIQKRDLKIDINLFNYEEMSKRLEKIYKKS
jgi:DNA polymerase IV